MQREDILADLNIDKTLAQKYEFNPYFCPIESGLNDRILIEGEEFINLASNNYLGLATDSRVTESIAAAVKQYGASMCGTPIATGSMILLQNLQRRLANFIGLEDSMIFPSGYQANCAVFLSLARPADLIIIDHFAHASLIQGVRMTGCKIKPFLHNNVAHLRKLLEKSENYKRVFVVTESVFSTEGSIAPFDQIVSLCKKFQAIPVIDDSHGIGILGANGKGILEEKNIRNFEGIYTASLGKALANAGGVICGKKELVEYLKYSCPGFIYSTALPPPVIAGLLTVLDIIESEFFQRSKTVWDYKRMITECLTACGYTITENSLAPITSILVKDIEDCARIAKAIHSKKILVTPFIPPSVPVNENKIRIIAGANLSRGTLDYALERLKEVAREERLS